jgi:hypothetical protein
MAMVAMVAMVVSTPIVVRPKSGASTYVLLLGNLDHAHHGLLHYCYCCYYYHHYCYYYHHYCYCYCYCYCCCYYYCLTLPRLMSITKCRAGIQYEEEGASRRGTWRTQRG